MRELFLKQVQTEHVSGLTALLAFNSGVASSLKDVLKNRDLALAQYNKSIALLDTRTKERQKWQTAQAANGEPSPRASATENTSSGMLGSLMGKFERMVDDPNKGSRLLSKVTEAEKAHEECKSKWDDINRSISAEAQAFHVMTNADFSHGLREHVQQQLEFEDKQQKQWRELLAVFEQVPAD